MEMPTKRKIATCWGSEGVLVYQLLVYQLLLPLGGSELPTQTFSFKLRRKEAHQLQNPLPIIENNLK